MSIQIRQNTKGIEANAIIASLAAGKPAVARRNRKTGADIDVADAMATLRALAQAYEQVADGLLDQIHNHAGNLKMAHSLSRHLDWVGARAQMVDSFIKAGDCALTYVCASPDSHDRLVPLVQLAARNAATPGGLPVALYLMERIDEELRLV